MEKKIEIGQDAKVVLKWYTTSTEASQEKENSLRVMMAKKYGIPVKNIIVDTVTEETLTDGVIATNDFHNFNDPNFMLELCKKWIEINKIENIDFDEIVKIDSQINSLIDFNSYDKGKRYSIKWMKWSNFFSFGPDNFFDFTTLHGLVLLNGEPANKSGKSTFAYDLLHFLLFGKYNTNKAKTLEGLFNNYLPDQNILKVEGCINIDGEDYIIRRQLTRPDKSKKTRKITSKVEYYKLSSTGAEELLPDTNEQGASTTATSQIIKEALGNESDFDMIISANAKDLDSLITDTTETEKGKILSRWIGLSILEDKNQKAREKWNKEISKGRFSDMYNRVQLQSDVDELEVRNKTVLNEIKTKEDSIAYMDKQILKDNELKDSYLSAKLPIDEALEKNTVTSLEIKKKDLTEEGTKLRTLLETAKKEFNEAPMADFSEDEYKALLSEKDGYTESLAEMKAQYTILDKTNQQLKTAEYCPTCHRKLDNVDNSASIKKNEESMEALKAKGFEVKTKKDAVEAKINEFDAKRAAQKKRAELELKVATTQAQLTDVISEFRATRDLLNSVQKNKEAIAKNGDLDAKINVVKASIAQAEDTKKAASLAKIALEKELDNNKEIIALKKSYLVKIEEERKVEKYWKLYIQMMGNDGISKMVLRNTLPIINREVNKLLQDASDFKVEISINEKNDVDFSLVRDGVKTMLGGASGLERTQAALALRVILGKMSRLSRPPFILLDEILGTVAKVNYDDMKKLYDKIVSYYDFILHITHIDDIADWHDNVVTIQKVGNISKIKGN